MSRRAVIAAFVTVATLTLAGCAEESAGTPVEETTTAERSTQEAEPAGEVAYTAPAAS